MSSPTVLIIDDDSALRATVGEALRDDGFDVETAANGALALSKVASVRPALIILDLNMPVMDGQSFALAYRRQAQSPVPIILLSGIASDRVANQIGAVAYLAKPVDLETLLDLVRRLVRSGDERRFPSRNRDRATGSGQRLSQPRGESGKRVY